MWRTVGFLMSFAVVLEGMSVVAYLIVLSGGKRLRESGWKVLSLLIILSALVQAASMSVVVSLSHTLVRSVVDTCGRHTCMTMRTVSSSAGGWASPGFIAPSAGA